ncbi:MAG TPA: hypothetical protein VH208_07015, partial [Myxococcaceae bacterium]|nr:hypothetical protein [Myxococcaceae bacterium]
MRRTVGATVALLALLPAARALDSPGPAGAPAEQYKALLAEYDQSFKDFIRALGAAKDNDEREKVFKEKYPVDQLAPRLLEFAEKNPKGPEALGALLLV